MIALIDIGVLLAALNGANVGRKNGFGLESVRLLRRAVPALFSFSCYGAVARPLANLIGLKDGASEFWAFVLILGLVLILMLKLRSKLGKMLETLGGRLPKWAGALAGVLRSLGTSSLVLFPLAMAPWDGVRNGIAEFSWFAALLQKLLGQ